MPSMQNMAIDPQARPALGGRVRLQTDPVSGEPVLLYPEGLLQLNETAHAVLSRCDGKATVEEIVVSLADEYEADAGMLRADVLECLAHFQQRQFVTLAA